MRPGTRPSCILQADVSCMVTRAACGAVMQAALPCGRFACAAVSLAGPAAGFALTIAARACGGCRLAGASALLSLFNLLPLPPLDGGMALRHLADGRCAFLLDGIAGVSVLVLLAGGVLLWRAGGGGWMAFVSAAIAVRNCRIHGRGQKG